LKVASSSNSTANWSSRCPQNGPVPADLVPRLTERFYRVDAGRSRASGGTGLGLAIVKYALQRHGSALEIESEEGKGSRFSCRFPSNRVVVRHGARPGVV
jgi:two-component system phosphate regulon sensor histidine kinase PhoR